MNTVISEQAESMVERGLGGDFDTGGGWGRVTAPQGSNEGDAEA